jgi:hypothetical protein
MFKVIKQTKNTLYIYIFFSLLFSKSVGAETFEELMISTWGNLFKKDLAASTEIEKNYFECTRDLEYESIREAKSNGTLKYLVKMDNSIYFDPVRYDCQTELCNKWQYRYTAIGGFDVYGNGVPDHLYGNADQKQDYRGGINSVTSGFIFKKKLTLLERRSGNYKKISFQCTEIDSFFKRSITEILFLTGDARRSIKRYLSW